VIKLIFFYVVHCTLPLLVCGPLYLLDGSWKWMVIEPQRLNSQQQVHGHRTFFCVVGKTRGGPLFPMNMKQKASCALLNRYPAFQGLINRVRNAFFREIDKMLKSRSDVQSPNSKLRIQGQERGQSAPSCRREKHSAACWQPASQCTALTEWTSLFLPRYEADLSLQTTRSFTVSRTNSLLLRGHVRV